MSLAEKPSYSEGIIDINIDGAQRQRFRINGDPNSIIELNLSDMGILERLKTGLQQLQDELTEITSISTDDENLSEKMHAIDHKMRESVDYIFDYPVSDVCAKYGTMYDPKDGKLRYESIIDALTKLYTTNLNEEYKKINNRIKKHTDKYTKSSKKSRK